MPRSSAAAITSASRMLPPGWITQLAPASQTTSRPSRKGKNASLATGASLRQRIASFVLLHLGYFPEGRQAPKHVMPTGEVDLTALVDAVRRDLARLDAAAVKARERFGGAKVLDHPILGAMTVEEWLKFHLVHTRHHEKQIRTRLRPPA